MRENFNIVLPNASSNKEKSVLNPKFITSGLIKDIIRRGNEIRDQTIVIKLPSLIIDNDELLTNFAENVQLINFCGAKIFIIHDHTNLVNETLKLLGFDEKFIDNVKVVDHRSLRIIEMVLSGYINKLIVSKLCSLGCCAIGISGKDANLIQAKRSKILRKSTKEKDIIDVGFTSEPVIINPEILLNFEESNIIPIISPIASDDKGHTHLLDVNLTASIISSSLDADHLILMNNEGSREDFKVQDTRTLYNILNKPDFDQKMMSLIEAAVSSIENSANIVHFVNATVPDAILLSIFKNHKEEE